MELGGDLHVRFGGLTDLRFSRAVLHTAEPVNSHVTAEPDKERHRVGCKR
jgi:hypothetical protein